MPVAATTQQANADARSEAKAFAKENVHGLQPSSHGFTTLMLALFAILTDVTDDFVPALLLLNHVTTQIPLASILRNSRGTPGTTLSRGNERERSKRRPTPALRRSRFVDFSTRSGAAGGQAHGAGGGARSRQSFCADGHFGTGVRSSGAARRLQAQHSAARRLFDEIWCCRRPGARRRRWRSFPAIFLCRRIFRHRRSEQRRGPSLAGPAFGCGGCQLVGVCSSARSGRRIVEILRTRVDTSIR